MVGGGMAAIAWPMFFRQVYTLDDLGNYFLPLRDFYADCLRTGDAFFWTPRIFCGFHLHGEGQTGMLHPWHLVIYRLLPLDIAFNLEILSSYAVMLAGMSLFLRRRGLSRTASAFGALVFAFSGFNLLHFMHIITVAIIAHVPWLLICIQTALCSPLPRRRSLGWLGVALLTASQTLMGYPQGLLLSFLIEAWFVGFLFWTTKPLRGCGRLLGAKLLGITAGAAQILPMIDQFQNSLRSRVPVGWVLSGSLPPLNLAQLFGPYLLPDRVIIQHQPTGRLFGGNVHEFGVYCGAVTTVLVAWLLFRRSEWGRQRKTVLGAALLGLFALIMAFGSFGGLYRLQVMIPLLGGFRVPSRYIAIFHFALSILAAVAADQLLGNSARTGRRNEGALLLVCPGIALFLSAIALGWKPPPVPFWNMVIPHGFAPAGMVISSAGLLAAASVLAWGCLRKWPWAGFALIAFAAADQTVYGLSYLHRAQPMTVQAVREKAGNLPAGGGERLLAQRAQDSDIGTMAGRNLVGGLAGMMPDRRLDYKITNAMRVAACGWRQATKEEAAAASEPQTGTIQWLRVPDPMPRVRLVTECRVSTKPAADIAGIDVSGVALVENPIDTEPGEAGKASIVEERPGCIRVAVEARTRQFLVVSESYHGGWRATANGKPAPVERAYGDFMGCVVGPGRSEIVLRFLPSSLTAGAVVSGAAFALIAGVFLAGQRRSPAGGSGPARE